MSRRDGTFKIRQDKPVKNCGTTVITPRTKGDTPSAKSTRNIHTIDKKADSFIKDDFLPNDLVMKEAAPPFAFELEMTLPPTYFASNEPESLTFQEGKEWVNPGPMIPVQKIEAPVFPLDLLKPEDVSAGNPIVDKVEVTPIVPIPSVTDIDKTHEEQLTPEQEEALLKQRAEAAVSPNPIEAVKKHARGRKKKEEVVSTIEESLSPANTQEDNKE